MKNNLRYQVTKAINAAHTFSQGVSLYVIELTNLSNNMKTVSDKETLEELGIVMNGLQKLGVKYKEHQERGGAIVTRLTEVIKQLRDSDEFDNEEACKEIVELNDELENINFELLFIE